MAEASRQHLASHIIHKGLRSDNTLHVIGVVSNPVRFNSRYRLARDWRDQMEVAPNVQCYVVESAFGDREYEVTEPVPHHLRVRTRDEIWNKENLINLGVRTLLPRDWTYVAWVDADVLFRDPYWAQETLQQLQHWHVLQPWQSALDLGCRGDVLQTFQSFGFLDQSGVRKQVPIVVRERPLDMCHDPYAFGHPGYAWAATRTFWENAEGLVDWCILGSADHHMAWAMTGHVDSTIHYGMHSSFFRRMHEWQTRVMRVTHGHVGFSPGRIEHAFHGPKKNRHYRGRWQILVDHKFDPDTDLMRDAQGLLQLVGKPDLEHAIKMYNRSRREDDIDDTK